MRPVILLCAVLVFGTVSILTGAVAAEAALGARKLLGGSQ